MNSGSGRKVTICYMEGDLKRFVTGTIKEEDEHFLTLDLNKYELRIAINSIIKIEAVKQGRGFFEY
jgi:hypothetical protein